MGATQTVGHSHMTQLDMGELGAVTQVVDPVSHIQHGTYNLGNLATWQKSDGLTRDFLGLTGDGHVGNGNGNGANGSGVNVSMNVREMLTYTGGLGFPQYNERDHALLKPHGFGYAQPPASETWGDC